MPGVFPDYPAPVVRNVGAERVDDDALGHAATTAHRRAAGHQHPQHVVATLAGLAQTGEPLLGPRQQLCRVCIRAEPRDEKKDMVWFALNEDRPLFAFAGIWTEFKGDRGTKSKPRVTPPPLELRAKVFRQVGSE
jgi:hypothetical protein